MNTKYRPNIHTLKNPYSYSMNCSKKQIATKSACRVTQSTLSRQAALHASKIPELTAQQCEQEQTIKFMDKVCIAQRHMIENLREKISKQHDVEENEEPIYEYIPPPPPSPQLIRQGKRGYFDPKNNIWVSTYEEALQGALQHKKELKLKK